MSVRGCDCVNPFLARIADHLQKKRVNKGFSLKIKNEEEKVLVGLVDEFAEQFFSQISSGSGETAESGRALWATQVTGGGWFN
jgi:hypothetical protein